jgi:hypothetical protein
MNSQISEDRVRRSYLKEHCRINRNAGLTLLHIRRPGIGPFISRQYVWVTWKS